MLDFVETHSDTILVILNIILIGGIILLTLRQNRLMALEKKPELQISNHYFEGEEVVVELSNYGSGLSKNLRVVSAANSLSDEEFKPMMCEFPLNRVDDGERSKEDALLANERRITFRGSPSFGFEYEGKRYRYGGMSAFIEDLHHRDIDSIWFKIWIVGDDRLGGCQKRELEKIPWRVESIEKLMTAYGYKPSLEDTWNFCTVLYSLDHPELPSPECESGGYFSFVKRKLMN